MKLGIGNDHAGTEYKEALAAYLKDRGITV